MEKYYKEFCFTMDNMEWHYARYSYSRHKKMEELFDLKNDIEKYLSLIHISEPTRH